jgi:hypothetical protein
MGNKPILITIGLLLAIATVGYTVVTVRKAKRYHAAYIEAQRISEHNAAFLAKLQTDIDDAQAANIACADKLIAYDRKAESESYRWQLDHLPTRPICVDVAHVLKTLQDGARELAAKGIELK